MSAENKNINNNPTQEKIKFILELFNSNKLIEARKEIDRQLIVYSKSSVLFNILGAVLVEQNKPQEAIENYNKSIKINLNYSEAYNNLGVCLYRLGRIDEAIQSYQKAIEIRPKHADTYNNLGAAFREKGELEKSIMYFQKAIKFAINKKYLINLKTELRNLALKSSLFDSKNYSNDFYEMLLNIKK